jgi:YHS domain-containing protein
MGFSRLLLVLVVAVLVVRALRLLLGGVIQGLNRPRTPTGPPDRGVQMARDPVCGTFVVPSRALVVNDSGTARYFCSEKCRDAYRSGGRPRAASGR